MRPARTTRRGGLPHGYHAAQAALASFGGLALLLLLGFFPWGRDPDKEYCSCGTELGVSKVPALVGPDPLTGGTVLTLENDRVLVDSTPVTPEPDSLHTPVRVASLLEHRRRSCARERKMGAAADDGCNLILRVGRLFPTKRLRPYLWAARQAGFREVAFVFRKSNRNWMLPQAVYSTAAVDLVGPSCTPFALNMNEYDVFHDLARAIIEQKSAGVSVHL